MAKLRANFKVCRKCDHLFMWHRCGVVNDINTKRGRQKGKKRFIIVDTESPYFVVPENCPFVLEQTVANQKLKEDNTKKA